MYYGLKSPPPVSSYFALITFLSLTKKSQIFARYESSLDHHIWLYKHTHTSLTHTQTKANVNNFLHV